MRQIFYNPHPIDTGEIDLSDEEKKLVEMLAENVHDVWARSRIIEGWVYGDVKDSEKKTTPCLVSYVELPESEKEYDRNTVQETLKTAKKLGYVLSKEGDNETIN